MQKIIENLQIDKIVFKGFGLGYKDPNPIFVNNAIPGDLIDVEIVHKRGKALFGKIIKYHRKSELSQPVNCKAFGDCGGCDWLNVPYKTQLKFKKQFAEDFFKNIDIPDVIASPLENDYRNKSLLPVSGSYDKPVIGMFSKRTHKVIPHNNCKILPDVFDLIVKGVETYLITAKVQPYNEKSEKGICRYIGLRKSEYNDEIILIIVTKSNKLPFTKQLIRLIQEKYPKVIGIIQNINRYSGNTIIGEEEKILYGKDYITEKIGEKLFKVNYKSFMQINTRQTKNLYDFVKNNVKDDDIVIDAYSGIGSIGIYISDKAKKVLCIEINPDAVENAKESAKLNNIENVEFINNPVEKYLFDESAYSFNTIIFDPPRKGVDGKTLQQVTSNEKIKKVIYVSCNLSTQKRDSDILIEGGFELKAIQPFDMFPQTYHVENVLVLTR